MTSKGSHMNRDSSRRNTFLNQVVLNHFDHVLVCVHVCICVCVCVPVCLYLCVFVRVCVHYVPTPEEIITIDEESYTWEKFHEFCGSSHHH